MTTMRITYLACDGPGCTATYPPEAHDSPDALGELSPRWLLRQASAQGWKARTEGPHGARGRHVHLCGSCSK